MHQGVYAAKLLDSVKLLRLTSPSSIRCACGSGTPVSKRQIFFYAAQVLHPLWGRHPYYSQDIR